MVCLSGHAETRADQCRWLETCSKPSLLFAAAVDREDVWVGLLTRRLRHHTMPRAASPSPAALRRAGRVAYRSGAPRSQWRDRAGFTPDFPVMPRRGTQTERALYHAARQEANGRVCVC